MFNKDLEKRIKKLENEVFPKEEEKDRRIYHYLWCGNWDTYTTTPIKKRVDNIIESQGEDRHLLDMLLDKLELEYVKITEENGDKKVRELLRKKRKKDKKKKKEELEDEE